MLPDLLTGTVLPDAVGVMEDTSASASSKHRPWERSSVATSPERSDGGEMRETGGEGDSKDSPAASLAEILDTAFTSSVDTAPQDHCGSGERVN